MSTVSGCKSGQLELCPSFYHHPGLTGMNSVCPSSDEDQDTSWTNELAVVVGRALSMTPHGLATGWLLFLLLEAAAVETHWEVSPGVASRTSSALAELQASGLSEGWAGPPPGW